MPNANDAPRTVSLLHLDEYGHQLRVRFLGVEHRVVLAAGDREQEPDSYFCESTAREYGCPEAVIAALSLADEDELQAAIESLRVSRMWGARPEAVLAIAEAA